VQGQGSTQADGESEGSSSVRQMKHLRGALGDLGGIVSGIVGSDCCVASETESSMARRWRRAGRPASGRKTRKSSVRELAGCYHDTRERKGANEQKATGAVRDATAGWVLMMMEMIS
jgi:hypothetical protein